MAFMDIFKKKKAAEEDLDLPPMPPEGFGNSQDFGSEMPSPPPLEDELDLPLLDDEMKPPVPIKSGIEISKQEGLPPLPSLSDEELGLPPLEEPQMPAAPAPMEKKYYLQKKAMPQMQKQSIRPKSRERPISQPIFLRVEKFRDILQGISNAKNSFKDTETGMELLTATEDKISRELGRWRSALEDAEKKLMFIDKILFKNE